jgi:hypothetical protein
MTDCSTLTGGPSYPTCNNGSVIRQKINQETLRLNYTVDQIAIYRALHPVASKYTFFSIVHETFSMTHSMLGHKTNLNEFKWMKSHQVSFQGNYIRNLEK